MYVKHDSRFATSASEHQQELYLAPRRGKAAWSFSLSHYYRRKVERFAPAVTVLKDQRGSRNLARKRRWERGQSADAHESGADGRTSC